MSEETTPEAPQKPVLQVLSGNPDDSQVAALTVLFAGLASAAAAAADTVEKDRNRWGSLEERLQRPATYNPSAFQNVSFY